MAMWCVLAAAAYLAPPAYLTPAAYLPRDLTIVDGKFVNASGAVELLRGSNVVVKGLPWLPPDKWHRAVRVGQSV